MATAASLERRRREKAAAWAKAVDGHRRSTALHRKLVQATCAALRAEIREARAEQARRAQPDLFSHLGRAA